MVRIAPTTPEGVRLARDLKQQEPALDVVPATFSHRELMDAGRQLVRQLRNQPIDVSTLIANPDQQGITLEVATEPDDLDFLVEAVSDLPLRVTLRVTGQRAVNPDPFD